MPTTQDAFRQKKFAHTFQCMDRNGNGHLDFDDYRIIAKELQALRGYSDEDARSAGLLRSQTRIWDELLEHTGKQGAAKITRDEYVSYLFKLADDTVAAGGKVPKVAMAIVHAYHRMMDHDGNGSIVASEYTDYLRLMNPKADGSVVFKLLSGNKDKIDLDQTEDLMAQYLLATDDASPGSFFLTGNTWL